MWSMLRFYEKKNEDLEEAKRYKLFALLPISRGFGINSSFHIDTTSLLSLVGRKDNRVKKYKLRVEERRRKERKKLEKVNKLIRMENTDSNVKPQVSNIYYNLL